MTITTRLHTCPVCHSRHSRPKAHRVPIDFALASVFTVLEVLIALRVDGWMAVALWAVVAVNCWRMLKTIIGLSVIAAGLLTDDPAGASR